MQKILVMTDIHLRGAGKTIIGLDPTARFMAALSAALGDHPDAAALILTGDLTHSGLQDEYDTLRACLADCTVPVLFMLGNLNTLPTGISDDTTFLPRIAVTQRDFEQGDRLSGRDFLRCLDVQ